MSYLGKLETAIKLLQEILAEAKKPVAAPVQAPQSQAQSKFLPPDVEHFVNVQEDSESIILEPKHYLQPKDFDMVNTFVTQHGGEYISKKMSRDKKPYWVIQNKGGA